MFLSVLAGCIIAMLVYGYLLYAVVHPRIQKRGSGAHEVVLIPALTAAFGPPIGLLLFAWAARPSIHWIVPTIGITIYAGSVFILMQCLFIYIPLSYPQFSASLFAANDFFRSTFACGSILLAHPLYADLGVAKGTTVFAGLSVLGIIGMWLLYYYGAKLRSMSKFAVSDDV